MITSFIVYNVNSGVITGTGACPDVDVPLQVLAVDEAIMEGAGRDDIHYIDLADPQNPARADRPACPAVQDKVQILANGVDEMTISGISAGTVVTVQDGVVPISKQIVNDGVLVFTSDYTGVYTFYLSHYRDLPKTFSVGVV